MINADQVITLFNKKPVTVGKVRYFKERFRQIWMSDWIQNKDVIMEEILEEVLVRKSYSKNAQYEICSEVLQGEV